MPGPFDDAFDELAQNGTAAQRLFVTTMVLRSTQKLVCVLIEKLGGDVTVLNDEMKDVDFDRLDFDLSDDGLRLRATYLTEAQVQERIEAEAQKIIEDFEAAVARGEVAPLGAPEPGDAPTAES